MKWFNIYETATGRLVSTASEGLVADPLPGHLTVEENLAGRPDFSLVVWDEGITAFKPRTPDPDELLREALKNKPEGDWTPGDIQNAKRLL